MKAAARVEQALEFKRIDTAAAKAKSAVRTLASSFATVDSYQNFEARVGPGTGNIVDGGTYGFHPLTRERTLLVINFIPGCPPGSVFARLADGSAGYIPSQRVDEFLVDNPGSVAIQ